jgi:ferrous iron transport protein A
MMTQLTLDMGEIGRRYNVVGINAGRGLTEKIMEMGIVPGTEIKIISRFGGHVIVMVRGSVIALSRGISRKILISPLE